MVNAALTGMVPMPDRVPHVPITPEAVVADAERCVEAGASVLHLHARDADGEPTWERSAYAEMIMGVRERCPGVVVCVTTSGRTFGEIERRADVLELEGAAKPDMASLTLGSLDFRTGASVNAPATVEALAERMRERGIKPELEVFHSGMAGVARTFLDRGLVAPPLYANILLGSPYTASATAGELAHIVDALPSDTVWAAAGIGAYQLPMNALAVFMGGHVRTGLEDNPYLHGKEPATNAALVRRVVELAAVAGRRPATPAEVRQELGLSQPASAPAL